MEAAVDLDAYFERIGHTGSRAPTLATLRAIHGLHPRAIPFENLDPLLGRPVRLDLASVQAKLVSRRRGGYCFEHNALLAAVLEALGFAVPALAARVRWMAPPEQPPGPRNHMLLRVDLADGAYLADVGFGGFLLAAPVRLEADAEQGTVRLIEADGLWTMQARLPDGWTDMYRFTLEPHFPSDYKVANWFTSTHPESLFTNHLLVQRLVPDGRLSLLDAKLTRRGRDGDGADRVLASAGELAEVIAEQFGIALPAEPAQLWDRLPK